MESAELEDALNARAYTSKNLPAMNTAADNFMQQGHSKDAAGRVEGTGEVYDNNQVTSTLILNNPSISRSNSPSKVDPESSKTSFESVGYCGEKNVHLSGNGTMVPKDSSTSNRANLRAASLAANPLIDGGLGGPSVAFDTGRRSSTVPFVTRPQPTSQKASHATDVREPAPPQQLPNINETLEDLAPLRHDHTPLAPAPVKYINIASAANPAASRERGLSVNPYVRRADEIGPKHGIPGVGHIGALLTPPGWKIGDEPITDVEAEQLYDQARAQAAQMLNVSVDIRGNITSADHVQRNAEEAEQWQRQLRIDNVCLAERKWMYSKWRECKAFRFMQTQQQYPVQSKPRVVPSPIHPPTQTSIHAYQRYQQAQLPSSPLSPYRSNPPLPAGTLSNRLQYLQRGLHLPARSPMSPSFLDPNLVPQTLDSIYAHYRTNRITILQMHEENEDFLTSWTTKFGLARPQGLPVTPMPQYMNGNGQQARPITNIYPGHDQGQLCPHHEKRGLQENSQDAPITRVQESSNRPLYNQRLGPGPFDRAPAQVGRIPLLERSEVDANRLPERTIERFGTPQSNVGGHKPGSEKPLVWRQERSEHPYAPTTTASQERQIIGSGAKSKTTGLISATQQAIRSDKKPAINAKNGFSVSADQARRLIALGVTDATSMRPGTVRGGSLPAATTIRPAFPSSATLSNVQSSNGVAGSGSSAIVGTGLGVVSNLRANSPSPSVESSDDPKDATFGVNPPRKIPSVATGRKSTVAGNKRKAGKAESAPTLKRTRMSLAHMAKDDA